MAPRLIQLGLRGFAHLRTLHATAAQPRTAEWRVASRHGGTPGRAGLLRSGFKKPLRAATPKFDEIHNSTCTTRAVPKQYHGR